MRSIQTAAMAGTELDATLLADARGRHVIWLETHLPQLGQNALAMRGRPIDATALWTAEEMVLRRMYVGGDGPGGRGPVHGCQRHVAACAPAATLGVGIQCEGRDHLLQLLAEGIAANEERGRHILAAQKMRTSRQQDATFRPCVTQQRRTPQVRAVGGILTDDPQPRRQAAKHPVDGEAVHCHEKIPAAGYRVRPGRSK
jgi:hypothetical protein